MAFGESGSGFDRNGLGAPWPGLAAVSCPEPVLTRALGYGAGALHCSVGGDSHDSAMLDRLNPASRVAAGLARLTLRLAGGPALGACSWGHGGRRCCLPSRDLQPRLRRAPRAAGPVPGPPCWAAPEPAPQAGRRPQGGAARGSLTPRPPSSLSPQWSPPCLTPTVCISTSAPGPGLGWVLPLPQALPSFWARAPEGQPQG